MKGKGSIFFSVYWLPKHHTPCTDQSHNSGVWLQISMFIRGIQWLVSTQGLVFQYIYAWNVTHPILGQYIGLNQHSALDYKSSPMNELSGLSFCNFTGFLAIFKLVNIGHHHIHTWISYFFSSKNLFFIAIKFVFEWKLIVVWYIFIWFSSAIIL